MIVIKSMTKNYNKKQEVVHKDLEKLFISNTLEELNYFLPKVINKYIESFSDLLLNLDIDNDSLAKPEYFFDSYKEELENFTFIRPISNLEIKIVLPDVETFNFNNRLFFIQLLTMGFVGSYLEISKKDYDLLITRGDLSKQLIDVLNTLPGILDESDNELDFYILDTSLNVHNILQKILGKNLVVFPFSNTAPVPIFEEGIAYYNSNKQKMFDQILTKSMSMLKRRSY